MADRQPENDVHHKITPINQIPFFRFQPHASHPSKLIQLPFNPLIQIQFHPNFIPFGMVYCHIDDFFKHSIQYAISGHFKLCCPSSHLPLEYCRSQPLNARLVPKGPDRAESLLEATPIGIALYLAHFEKSGDY
jgi:hypothetical protein